MIKSNPLYADFLPAKINTHDIKSRVKNRTDFNREIKSLERFMKKGSEKMILTEQGIKTTAYEKREITLRVRSINIKRKKIRGANKVGRESGNLAVAEDRSLFPKQFNLNQLSPKGWDRYKKNVYNQTQSDYYNIKNEQYKRSYIIALYKTLPVDLAEQIESLLNNVDGETMYNLSLQDTTLDIIYTYSPEDARHKGEVILNRWKMYV